MNVNTTYNINILKAFKEPPAKVDYVLPSMIAGTVGALIAQGGTGKSMLALQIAMSIACGDDFADLFPSQKLKQGKVVYLAAEDPDVVVRQRVFSLASYLNYDQQQTIAKNLLISPITESVDIRLSSVQADITNLAVGCRLLILDTLRCFHFGDENSNKEMSEVLNAMRTIAFKSGCSIVFLHHTNKLSATNGGNDAQQASRGSSVLVDNVRWQAYLTNMSAKEAKYFGISSEQIGSYVRFGLNKVNYGTQLKPIWLKRDKGGVLSNANLDHSKQIEIDSKVKNNANKQFEVVKTEGSKPTTTKESNWPNQTAITKTSTRNKSYKEL